MRQTNVETQPATTFLSRRAPAAGTLFARPVLAGMSKKRRPNAAQLRGDIDRGRAGDKAPGVDPAAAPMETDAEAGGAPPTPAEIAEARRAERRPARGDRNAVDPRKTPSGG